ncbi:MAG: 8-oxo-dGTP diphosphatase [Lachnospiraceae bacterium]|nr:8-oxo-dGTP diphosphatase [Lachnospiraceae bacterium]
MARTEQVELTCLCMIYKEDMILLQNRVKKDWKGYTLPGGHIEPGESFVDGVIREMKEETGLTIVNPRLCGIKQFPIEGGRYMVLLYKTDEFEGELVSSEEGQMEWICRKDLDKVNTVNDLTELFQVMESDDLSEFQYIIEDGTWKVALK